MLQNDPGADALKASLTALSARLLRMGIEGAHFSDLLEVFCTGLNDFGAGLMRVHVTLRAHHPEFGSIAHRWRRDDGTESQTFNHVYTPRREWVTSPLYYLSENNVSEIRQRLTDPDPVLDFPFFDDLRAAGGTDYIALKVFFFAPGDSLAVDPNHAPEGCLISLTGDGPDGFSDQHLDAIRDLLPSLLLALKSNANRQMAADIAATYLGRDAGTRVLSGDIIRGSVQHIDAVICYFDLSGFTKLSEALSGEDIVEMLNDYFCVTVDVIENHGGNVLKFMGDGMLAVFDVQKNKNAGRAAIEAAVTLRREMQMVSDRRTAEGLTATGFTLALHGGEVLYGNIGGRTRLDFTVIGPAVNTTARLSAMTAHVDQNIIISARVARPVLETRKDLVSLGWYRLRGVSERQELFTLD
ncbi:adenylate/guanylate cyclase domain-containing protein [Roseobacter ponti]|uniref:Adenylate/guanylate cyclase domain-containing protein n=1 Tax=Roseobacter ponti TaxID=1891787 RepID=A0A858SWK7_9RHOB|nr:adenylate/guanylate cyclase domain-containing protein [Roseobacter ponti]